MRARKKLTYKALAPLSHQTALLDSTTLFQGSTWLYYILPWLYLTLLHSIYHGSTWLYYILPHSTMALLDSTWLYYILPHSTMALFDSTCLFHGSTSTWPYMTPSSTSMRLAKSQTVCPNEGTTEGIESFASGVYGGFYRVPTISVSQCLEMKVRGLHTHPYSLQVHGSSCFSRWRNVPFTTQWLHFIICMCQCEHSSLLPFL